jgi:vancomycin resistance protein YoaR
MGRFSAISKVHLAIMGAIAVLGASGVLAALYGPVPETSKPPPETVPQVALRVAGHAVPADGDRVGQSLDLVRRYALAEIKLKLPDGRSVSVSRADFGLEIDRLRLSQFVNEALAPGSALARAHAASAKAGEPVDVPLPLRVDGDRAIAKLVDIKADVDKPSADATIDLEARKVRPEQIGYRMDVYGTLARLETAFRAGKTEVEVAVEEVVPKRRAAQLDGVKFDAVLGWFETRYSNAKKDEHRTYNLRLAASKLDGLVLMPGEELDFNEVVGPRDEAHGFRVAPVIAQGELVDGIGGGTCQISGTLHGAVFFAGLEVAERYPHSRPSSYIRMGLDATVSYPNINYRFKNPFDFPVVLHEKVAGGVVRAEILGPERKLTVSYFRRIDEVLPFEEVERETEKLASGERVVTQRGIPGFVATASRLVRDGAYAERWKWTEKYPPTTQIVMVGTGPEDTKPRVKQDSHPEYTVDEYLVLTQGPSNKGESAAMNEQREPGRTGEEGWIKKLGFEKTPIEPPDDDKEKDGDKKDADKSKDDKKKDDKAKDKEKSKTKSAKKKDPPKEG